MWFGQTVFPRWREGSGADVADRLHPPCRNRTNWLTTMMCLTIKNRFSIQCHRGRGGGFGGRSSDWSLKNEMWLLKPCHRHFQKAQFFASCLYCDAKAAFIRKSPLWNPFSEVCVFRPRKNTDVIGMQDQNTTKLLSVPCCHGDGPWGFVHTPSISAPFGFIALIRFIALAVHIIFLNVANIRFYCELVTALHCGTGVCMEATEVSVSSFVVVLKVDVQKKPANWWADDLHFYI